MARGSQSRRRLPKKRPKMVISERVRIAPQQALRMPGPGLVMSQVGHRVAKFEPAFVCPARAAVIWVRGNRTAGCVGADMLDDPVPRIGRMTTGNCRPDREKRAQRRSGQRNSNSSVQCSLSCVRKHLTVCGGLATRIANLCRANDCVQEPPTTGVDGQSREENRVRARVSSL